MTWDNLPIELVYRILELLAEIDNSDNYLFVLWMSQVQSRLRQITTTDFPHLWTSIHIIRTPGSMELARMAAIRAGNLPLRVLIQVNLEGHIRFTAIKEFIRKYRNRVHVLNVFTEESENTGLSSRLSEQRRFLERVGDDLLDIVDTDALSELKIIHKAQLGNQDDPEVRLRRMMNLKRLTLGGVNPENGAANEYAPSLSYFALEDGPYATPWYADNLIVFMTGLQHLVELRLHEVAVKELTSISPKSLILPSLRFMAVTAPTCTFFAIVDALDATVLRRVDICLLDPISLEWIPESRLSTVTDLRIRLHVRTLSKDLIPVLQDFPSVERATLDGEAPWIAVDAINRATEQAEDIAAAADQPGSIRSIWSHLISLTILSSLPDLAQRTRLSSSVDRFMQLGSQTGHSNGQRITLLAPSLEMASDNCYFEARLPKQLANMTLDESELI